MMNILYTDRLILRPFQEQDAKAMFDNWTSDQRVARHCRWFPHKSIRETEAFLNMCLKAEFCWAITTKGSDEPIGCIDVVGTNSAGVSEIGYVLSHRCWGQGIMTEAVKAVIHELFKCGYQRIGACHSIENPASGKVMEKCGMTYAETHMALRKYGSDEQIEVKYYEISQ